MKEIWAVPLILAGYYICLRAFSSGMRKLNWMWWYKHIYLKSLHWRFKRWQKKFWMGVTLGIVRCEKCGNQNNLHVHHVSYKHLYHEPLADLQVICGYCHRKGSGRI